MRRTRPGGTSRKAGQPPNRTTATLLRLDGRCAPTWERSTRSFPTATPHRVSTDAPHPPVPRPLAAPETHGRQPTNHNGFPAAACRHHTANVSRKRRRSASAHPCAHGKYSPNPLQRDVLMHQQEIESTEHRLELVAEVRGIGNYDCCAVKHFRLGQCAAECAAAGTDDTTRYRAVLGVCVTAGSPLEFQSTSTGQPSVYVDQSFSHSDHPLGG